MMFCQTKIILGLLGVISVALIFMQVPADNKDTLGSIVIGLFALAKASAGTQDK